jgi:hypothetical protein
MFGEEYKNDLPISNLKIWPFFVFPVFVNSWIMLGSIVLNLHILG